MLSPMVLGVIIAHTMQTMTQSQCIQKWKNTTQLQHIEQEILTTLASTFESWY